MTLEIATLGGGCFWVTEAVFQQIRGVKRVEPGYCGGHIRYPSSEAVSEGYTGHAEVVQMHFDTAVVSYRVLLETFFAIHDPTSLNRQGNDVGHEYRSVIYFHTPEQAAMARQVMYEVASSWQAPIVTEISSVTEFYPAEEYHQNYFKLNRQQEYCAMVVAPKVDQVRKFFTKKMAA
ncbi:MAG: peptide-methionine (S)-S-oxide reductase MsrA [Pseudomonadota bacterium]